MRRPIFFVLSIYLINFAGEYKKQCKVMDKLKVRISWLAAVAYAVVTFCVYLLSGSWLMTVGVLLLVIVADRLVQEYDERKRREWENIGSKYKKDGNE